FILACGFIYFFLKNSTFTIKNLKFSKSTAVDLLRDSWPLILSGIVISIYMKIDQVMIKEMLDSEAVGQYAAAVRLSEAWYFIPMVIASSLFPAIINIKNKSEELYTKRLKRLYTLMVWMGIIITLPLWFFSDSIIVTLFGVDYQEAVDVFNITIFIVILIFISSVHGKWLLVEGLQKYSLFYSLTGMITNVIANLYLIPKIGIIGAAYGTVLAQTVPYIWLLRDHQTRNHLLMIINSFLPLYLLKRD
ncbi:MAG: flippase, partial [Bacteroidales bacterium]|nr:flippase [Bacteroidales bacterium]